MSRIYRFADCRIDPARRELWRAGQLVELPPPVFDFLAYLIERHERAVGRDELVAAVWGKTAVSDTLLGQTVLRLRRELGDDAREQRLLRTIPRFGYRWVAPLEVSNGEQQPSVAVAAAQAPTVPPVDAAKPAAPNRSRIRWLMAGAVAAVAIAFALFIRPPLAPRPAPQRANPPSAVLPAEVDSSAEWAWTRLGVMDMVATRLRSSGVPSVPSEQVVALLNQPPANRVDLRAATAAEWLVTPRVHRDGDSWQISLDAVDGGGHRFTAAARANDLGHAARAATDQLLAAIGVQTAPPDGDAPYAEFIQRVDAAVLSDDAEGARRLIDQASAEQRRSPELRLRLAKLDFRAGKLGAAREQLTRLLDEAPANTAPRLRASILNGLGAVAIRADQPQLAQAHFGAAIELLAQQHDAEQLGQAYLGRAAAAADQHRFNNAGADYARARIAFRDAGDALAQLRVVANEGFVDLDQDRPAQALPQLRTASDGFRRWGALNETIFAQIGVIASHLALLDARAALEAADAASPLAQRVQNTGVLDSLALARARALAATGRLREARESLARLRGGGSDALTRAIAASVLARLELDAGNLAAAQTLAAEAVAALVAPGVAGPRAEAWLTQIRVLLERGDAEPAQRALLAFESWSRQQGEPRGLVYAQLARAEHAHRFGADAAGWRAEFVTARDLAAKSGVPLEIAAVARSHADALLGARDTEGASVEIGRVARWAESDFACAVLEARLHTALGHDAARQAALARARDLAGERTLPVDTLPLLAPAQSAETR